MTPLRNASAFSGLRVVPAIRQPLGPDQIDEGQRVETEPEAEETVACMVAASMLALHWGTPGPNLGTTMTRNNVHRAFAHIVPAVAVACALLLAGSANAADRKHPAQNLIKRTPADREAINHAREFHRLPQAGGAGTDAAFDSALTWQDLGGGDNGPSVSGDGAVPPRPVPGCRDATGRPCADAGFFHGGGGIQPARPRRLGVAASRQYLLGGACLVARPWNVRRCDPELLSTAPSRGRKLEDLRGCDPPISTGRSNWHRIPGQSLTCTGPEPSGHWAISARRWRMSIMRWRWRHPTPEALLLRGNLRAADGNQDGARADWQMVTKVYIYSGERLRRFRQPGDAFKTDKRLMKNLKLSFREGGVNGSRSRQPS